MSIEYLIPDDTRLLFIFGLDIIHITNTISWFKGSSFLKCTRCIIFLSYSAIIILLQANALAAQNVVFLEKSKKIIVRCTYLVEKCIL